MEPLSEGEDCDPNTSTKREILKEVDFKKRNNTLRGEKRENSSHR